MFALTLITEISWIYPSFSAMRPFRGDFHPAFITVFNVFFILFLPCKNKGFGYMTYMWSITVKFESVAALTAVLIP